MSSFDLNRVLMTGRLGSKPILKKTEKGSSFARFSVAMHRYGGKNEPKQTQWHNVVVWGNQAELCERYLDKGSSVLIEGQMDVHFYELEGIRKLGFQIVADRVQFIGGPRSTMSHDVVEGILDEDATEELLQ